MPVRTLVDARVQYVLPHVIGPRVLDVGCTGHYQDYSSPNWLHAQIRRRVEHTVGIDINLDRLAQMRSNGFTDLLVASAQDFAFSEPFDTIVAGELVEHLSNVGAFLDNCRRHLKSTGRLVLTTPHPFSAIAIAYALVKYPNTCQNDEHTAWLCPKTLRGVCERHGLRPVHFELIPDYLSEITATRYRLFLALLRCTRLLMPRLLTHNGMLLVCARSDAGSSHA